jgi:hypothetical protein
VAWKTRAGGTRDLMDLLLILATLAFFAVAAGYVVFCDRLIGHDDRTGSNTESVGG